jgi:glycerol-3-phosphate dehydrogenase
VFGERPAWTKRAPLPGGDFDVDGIERLVIGVHRNFPFLSEPHAQRLARAYGTRVRVVLGTATSSADLGPTFGGDLTAAEVRYLMTYEWAQTPDDVLWRRTKLGLRTSRDDRARLSSFMTGAVGDAANR